jgi:type II secretory pathway pseudopilin PulG
MLIVVVILGVLAALVVPSFASATQATGRGAAAESLRRFDQAFAMYYLSNQAFPRDRMPGVFPREMEGYLREDEFEGTPPLGERWDWNLGNAWRDMGPNISMWSSDDLFDTDWQLLDAEFDDGDLEGGMIRQARVGGHQLVRLVR